VQKAKVEHGQEVFDVERLCNYSERVPSFTPAGRRVAPAVLQDGIEHLRQPKVVRAVSVGAKDRAGVGVETVVDLHAMRRANLDDQNDPPRLKLVDGNLELLTAAVAGADALGALLDVTVADDWAGFPEALPVLCASYVNTPNGNRWGSLFFVEPRGCALVGFGGFKGPPSSDGIVEVGYAIAPAFQGQGLATDALAQMVQRAFVDPIVRAVDAHTLGYANPSTRVLEKGGFRKIGEANDPDVGMVWHWRRERPAP
jgi:[ribosomal protein S5]-alanine N-acetyltransferase